MSIFFDFDIGHRGWRFRRAVDADKYDIEKFSHRTDNEPLFGDVNIGSLIELSSLSICLIGELKEVNGFISFSDRPNVPAVDPADWEIWIRNMFQKHYLARNTLFVHFMCCKDEVADIFLDEAFSSVFLNDMYLQQVVIVLPPGFILDYFQRYKKVSKHYMHRFGTRRAVDDTELGYSLYVAFRQDFIPKLRIRVAVEEDNDDIVKILEKCQRITELYGEFYVSEVVARHPEAARKIIVADVLGRAVGVMCLNSDIDYKMLQDIYELRPFYGLRKATPLEQELKKRNNMLMKAFGDPVMRGQWSPYDRIKKTDALHLDDEPSTDVLHEQKSEKYNKVNFGSSNSFRHSFDHLYHRYHASEDSIHTQVSVSTSQHVALHMTASLLDEDPFDYEIVNIDRELLQAPEMEIREFATSFESTEVKPEPQIANYLKRLKIRRSSIFSTQKSEVKETIRYNGGPNAFMIELFGLRDDFDGRKSFDLLEAAFEAIPGRDYCIIRIPCEDKTFSLLEHFCYVPTKNTICCDYALYIAHRGSVLGKLRVRRAEIIDLPQMAVMLQSLDAKETMWTVENSVFNYINNQAYVLQSGLSLVGVAILEAPEQIDYIRAKYNLDFFHNHKYHYLGQGFGVGFCSLKSALVYPAFEPHHRFFNRELLRLSGSNAMVWLTAYRNKWILHKANSLAASMVPILPRKIEVDCVVMPELKKFANMTKDIMAFSCWFIDKKLTTVSRANIDTRIVVVGASRTAMAFLNELLFSEASAYLTFTNVTLISPNGLPYTRQRKAAAKLMFLKYRTKADKYLKSVPYTYYVNIINENMVEVNKQMKYIVVSNGARYHYDRLFLLFGKQFQHPDYLNIVFERDEQIKLGNVPSYTRLDVPNLNETETKLLKYDTPENVFIINNVNEANMALNYTRNTLVRDPGRPFPDKVVVYGNTIHAYCCINALIEFNINPEDIVFVEPFPPEFEGKIRVPVFCNTNVDKTIGEVLDNLKITVYRAYYFDSWIVDVNGYVSHVSFVSHTHMMKLNCSTFFYYGMRGIDPTAFVAINKSGMAYDGGILIDNMFRTKDPSIYAAGPVTRYNRRYYAEDKRHKYFDSYEVGAKLGAQIRNELNPLFRFKEIVREQKSTGKQKINFDLSGENEKSDEKIADLKLPAFQKPIVTHCYLPGGLQYLEVRPPGRKLPHYYLHSLNFKGYVMETFKGGYFKLHLTEEFIVDGITCLTPEKFSLDNFRKLFGLSAVVLNNVHFRFGSKKIEDFFDFFRQPWAYFLYHEHRDELFAIVKELLPRGITTADTIAEALRAIGDRLSNPSYKVATKYRIRSNFEKSPHIEAITSYVVEWLSEIDPLLPVYAQPWVVATTVYDLKKNAYFKRRKRTMHRMMAQAVTKRQ